MVVSASIMADYAPVSAGGTAVTAASTPPHRLLSIDFMRGLIMVLLMLESAELYDRLLELEGTPFHALASSSTTTRGTDSASGT